MSGHMSYFTTPARPREDRRFLRPQPEEINSLWGAHGLVRRPRRER
jgi:hypothetical protein